MSLISGHAAAAFGSAGLVCARQLHQPIYPRGDLRRYWGCPVVLGLAATTSALRVLANRHWASDVASGAALGFATGYLMPLLVERNVHAISTAHDRGRIQFLLGGGVLGGSGLGWQHNTPTLSLALETQQSLYQHRRWSLHAQLRGEAQRDGEKNNLRRLESGVYAQYTQWRFGLDVGVERIERTTGHQTLGLLGPALTWQPQPGTRLSLLWQPLWHGALDRVTARAQATLWRWLFAELSLRNLRYGERAGLLWLFALGSEFGW